ncbi:MAG: class I SAM-dependent methyltransferase [Alphaproteobacteria bacterium]|nr:class I SAM-dependent methyltransferase [Alphaproteobacteria bacterium]
MIADLRAQIRLIDARIGANRLDEAAALLAPLLDADPQFAEGHYRMAAIWQRRGKLREAIAEAAAAARLAPDWAEAHKHLGRLLLRNHEPEPAVAAFERARAAAPQLSYVHQQLGLALADLQKWSRGERALRCAAALDPTATITHTQLWRLLIRQRKYKAACDYVRARIPSAATFGMMRRDTYYTYDQVVSTVLRSDGVAAAAAIARPLLERFWSAPGRPILAGDEAARSFLGAIADATPHTPLDQAVAALLDGRPLDAFDQYAKWLDRAAGRDNQPLPEKYNATAPDGAFGGHPAWHLMSPFYHLWTAAQNPTDGAGVQTNWQAGIETLGAPLAPDRLISGLEDGIRFHQPLLDALAPMLRRRPLRMIDVGCGRGDWLYVFARDFGVDLAGLFGCDLHPERVRTARNLLRHHARNVNISDEDFDRLTENNLFAADLLATDAEALTARCGRLDLAFLARITMMFSDAQLDRLIGVLSAAGIAQIVEFGPVDQWTYCYGRADLRPHFARHGYQPTADGWLTERLTGENARYLVLPRKYWVATRYYVFERAG